jgi:hypothetical protein
VIAPALARLAFAASPSSQRLTVAVVNVPQHAREGLPLPLRISSGSANGVTRR